MFHLWLFFTDRCIDYALPEEPGYHAELRLAPAQTGWKASFLLPVRYLDGEWRLTLPEGFACEQSHLGEVTLGQHRVLSGPLGVMAIDAMRFDTLVMEKYAIPTAGLTIGRAESCALRSDSPLVSASHGTLRPDGRYTDTSHNGTYINGTRLTADTCQLRMGDLLQIAPEIKLVYLGDHIAVLATVPPRHVSLPPWQPASPSAENAPFVSALVEVHRAPRLLSIPDNDDIKIDPPPPKAPERDQPLWLTVGPSSTMVLPMLMGVLVSSLSGGNGNVMTSGLTMIGASSALAVGWATVNFCHQKRQAKRQEQARVALYQQYIQRLETRLRELNLTENRRLLRTNPSAEECSRLTQTDPQRLWERLPTHSDFLHIRLGLGQERLSSTLTTEKSKLSLTDDPLLNEPERLVKQYQYLPNAPIRLSLLENSLVGILGKTSARAIAASIVVQLAALHSYHDVKLVILVPSQEDWQWARWLPHVFPTEDRTLRMVVSQPQGIREVLGHLEEVLQLRAEASPSEDKASLVLPHYVVVCMQPALIETEPVLNRLLSPAPGFSMLVAAPVMEQLPKECAVVLSARSRHAGLFRASGGGQAITYDPLPSPCLPSFGKALAPMRVNDSVLRAAIPPMVTFLEILGITDVNRLDVWRNWNENHAYNGLDSVIGLRAGNRPFTLDISDKKHGPHGLVAGTTGSGKSVMLQTYILSLALRYHPRDVQFILIDYKGGGMSDAFLGLPHLAGTIDNLQGDRAIRRALASVQGEIRRREEIFKSAGVSNIDEYMRVLQQSGEMEPLAHLIIVVDEFAELKKEQPDFMRELISASRVGRSMGIHLILATQKPGNSVDDEIWSNSRFRICLRVQDRADSMDMLKRPEASFIKGMGRCYVQIGNNEIFEEVQTSWSGAAYEPHRATALQQPRLLNEAGQPQRVATRSEKSRAPKITQMDALLNHIRQTAQMRAVPHARALWMDELPGMLDLQALPALSKRFDGKAWPDITPGALPVCFGLADDLRNQRHITAEINLLQCLNLLIVGQPAAGKTTFLQTLALSLALTCPPDRVQLYLLALTSRTLGNLAELPHTGCVVYEDEPESVERLLYLLTTESERRKRLFASVSTDNFAAYDRARQSLPDLENVPAWVVIVDRIAQLLAQTTQEDSLRQLHTLIREGSSRGIFFVVTALSVSELPIRLRDSFRGIALQMHSRADISDTLNLRLPPEINDPLPCAGRGMMVLNGAPYEMQTAILQPELTDAERSVALRALSRQMTDAWHGPKPLPLPRIDPDFTWVDLLNAAPYPESRETLPLGLRHIDAQPALAQSYEQFTWLIAGNRGSGKTTLLRTYARLLQAKGGRVHIFCMPTHRAAYASVQADFPEAAGQTTFLQTLDELILSRNQARKAVGLQNKEALHKLHLSFAPEVILLDEVNLLMLEPPLKARLVECATVAAGFGVYLLASINVNDIGMARRDPLLQALSARQEGICLCKLTECDLWDADLPYALRNQPVPKGQGLLVSHGKVQRLAFPKE